MSINMPTEKFSRYIYTKGITDGITVGLKKPNHIVKWYFYQQNNRRSYWKNNFVCNVIGNI
jgi:hypothetical protein